MICVKERPKSTNATLMLSLMRERSRAIKMKENRQYAQYYDVLLDKINRLTEDIEFLREFVEEEK